MLYNDKNEKEISIEGIENLLNTSTESYTALLFLNKKEDIKYFKNLKMNKKIKIIPKSSLETCRGFSPTMVFYDKDIFPLTKNQYSTLVLYETFCAYKVHGPVAKFKICRN